MAARQILERRTGTSVFKSQRSLFLQVPPRIAVPSLLLAVCVAALADYLSPPTLWYGPAYLLVIAFAAWGLGRRRAIGLGLLIIGFNFLVGNAIDYPYGPDSALLNFGFKVTAVIGIVLLLGAARSALEKEWRLARTDQLTGALNRQAFFEAIGANEDSRVWSVLIYADLDGLKNLNDRFGHERGDAGLVAFARRVRSAIRKDDLFARMGGDEFVVLMNIRDENAGVLVANRLNRALNVELPHDETQLLSSLGVLISPPGLRSIDTELKTADTLMYEAKRTKIGMLVATAKVVGRKIVLSRHIAHAPPADRKTAIRSNSREITAEIELASCWEPGERTEEAIEFVVEAASKRV